MKKNIAIVSGGNSSEYVISVKSALQVKEALQQSEFELYPIVIRENDWYLESDESRKIDKNDFSLCMESGKVKFDAVFNIIHGTPGEDGKLQGYFDMLNIPYTSPNACCSALTFNKYMCKSYLEHFKVPMAEAVWLREGDELEVNEIAEQLGFPMFVKPNNGGSSFGISKVNKTEELAPAVQKAFGEDTEVIIESFVGGTEVTCGVVELDGYLKTYPICEIVSENEFFDYEAKYTEGRAQEIIPARISEAEEDAVAEMSVKIYDALNCKGIVRIDYILKDGVPYFIEINTVPGMSKESIIPKMVRSAGEDFGGVLTSLLNEIL